jgi:hypothetical protein
MLAALKGRTFFVELLLDGINVNLQIFTQLPDVAKIIDHLQKFKPFLNDSNPFMKAPYFVTYRLASTHFLINDFISFISKTHLNSKISSLLVDIDIIKEIHRTVVQQFFNLSSDFPTNFDVLNILLYRKGINQCPKEIEIYSCAEHSRL